MTKGYALLRVAEQYLFFLRLYFSSRYALALFLLTGKRASVPINTVDMNSIMSQFTIYFTGLWRISAALVEGREKKNLSTYIKEDVHSMSAFQSSWKMTVDSILFYIESCLIMKNIWMGECSFCRVSMQNKEKSSKNCEKVKRLIIYYAKKKEETKLITL